VATLTQSDPPIAWNEYPRLKRFTRADCELFERLGKLPDRYELLEGQIVLAMSQKHFHAFVVAQVFIWLASAFGALRARTQATMAIDDFNMPEPDVFVLSEDFLLDDTYADAREVILVAEVSDSTLRDDLQVKASIYARAGIPEYWVIDIRGRQVFVHSEPRDGFYQTVRALAESDTISAPGRDGAASVLVSRLLPPVESGVEKEG
jgi:Uma2 family endonuclease